MGVSSKPVVWLFFGRQYWRNCLERIISELTYYVLSGTLNYSLTHSGSIRAKFFPAAHPVSSPPTPCMFSVCQALLLLSVSACIGSSFAVHLSYPVWRVGANSQGFPRILELCDVSHAITFRGL